MPELAHASDDSDHLPLYENYCSDHSLKVRNSKDKVTDTRSKELIDLCIGDELRILNSRVLETYMVISPAIPQREKCC